MCDRNDVFLRMIDHRIEKIMNDIDLENEIVMDLENKIDDLKEQLAESEYSTTQLEVEKKLLIEERKKFQN